MNVFDILAKRFTRQSLIDAAIESVKETLPELEDTQTSQMSFGLTNTGDFIQPEYRSTEYARFKKSQKRSKAPFGTPDLHDTGDFYNKVVAKYNNQTVTLTSTDSKTPDLTKKYDNIFGLNDQFQSLYNKQDVLPVFKHNLRKKWKLTR